MSETPSTIPPESEPRDADPTTSDPAGPQPGMVQDEITGQWLPEGETVELQGYRVGAEGKQILLDRLRTGQAISGALERPTVLRRFGAMFLDGLIVSAGGAIIGGVLGFVFAMVFMAGGGFSGSGGGGSPSVFPEVFNGVFTLIGLALTLGYFTLMHGFKGQTVGKMAARLKVVNADLSPISMSTAWWRAVFFAGPRAIPALTMLAVPFAPAPLAAAALGANALVGVYFLTNAIFALADSRQQRALHDRFAKTRVVYLDS